MVQPVQARIVKYMAFVLDHRWHCSAVALLVSQKPTHTAILVVSYSYVAHFKSIHLLDHPRS